MFVKAIGSAKTNRHRWLIVNFFGIIAYANGGICGRNKAVFVRNQLDDFLLPIFIPKNIVQIQFIFGTAAVVGGSFRTSHIDSACHDEIHARVGNVHFVLFVLAKILSERKLQRESRKKQ